MSFQLGSALLDACVLAVLKREDTYGYELTQNVKEIIDISDSTMYPVLHRLKKKHLLETYDKAHQGRNRRYYAITDNGKAQLHQYRKEWKIYKSKVDKVLLGEEENNE